MRRRHLGDATALPSRMYELQVRYIDTYICLHLLPVPSASVVQRTARDLDGEAALQACVSRKILRPVPISELGCSTTGRAPTSPPHNEVGFSNLTAPLFGRGKQSFVVEYPSPDR